MPQVDVLSESKQIDDKERIRANKQVSESIPSIPTVEQEESPTTTPTTRKPGERLDIVMSNTPDTKSSGSYEDVLLDWGDARLSTPMEDTTTYNPITGKTVMEELTGIQDDIVMNYISPNPKPYSSNWLKEAGTGLYESVINGAKLPAQLSIWGGMLASSVGHDTLGKNMIEWGNEKINNIDYMLNELNPGVNRSTLAYNISSAIGDVFAALVLGKASKILSTKIPYTPAEAVFKEIGGKMTLAADQNKLQRFLTATKMDVVRAFDFGSRAVPFAYMMGRDIGSFTEERIKQYNDSFNNIDWERLSLDNIHKELGATTIYGVGATWMEKKLGLGLLMKNAPKGADISLNAIRNYVLRGGEAVNSVAGKHAIMSYLGLSVASEAFTEASQELWQVSQEIFFKLPEKYRADGEDVFAYRQKEFGETLQRIATSALIGGTIGGASASIMVQGAKNQFVSTASPVLEEVYTTTGREGKVLSPAEAKIYANRDASKIFYDYYGKSTSILAKELQTKESLAMGSGTPFAEMNQYIYNKITDFAKATNTNLSDPQLDATNATIQLSWAITNLLSAKGVSVQDWKKDLDISITSTDQGLLSFTAKWKGINIFSSRGGFNTNTYYQQLTDGERGALETWEEIPVRRVEEDYTTDIGGEKVKVSSSLVHTAPNGETYTLLNPSTQSVVENTADLEGYYNAVSRLGKIESEAIKSVSIPSTKAGAFSTSLGSVFINPRINNPTTLLHEFGHMYWENLFVTLHNLESFRNTDLGKAATNLLTEVGVKPGQTHLTTQQSELLADLMSAELTGSAIDRLKRGVSRKLIKSLQVVESDAKRRAAQGFARYNNGRFISISPTARDVLNKIFHIPLDQIQTPVQDLDRYNAIKAMIPQGSTVSAEDLARTLATNPSPEVLDTLPADAREVGADVLVDYMSKVGDTEGIKNYYRDNIVWDDSLDMSTTRGQLNHFYVQQVSSIAYREGLTPQEVLQSDLLFQSVSLTPEETISAQEAVSRGTEEDVQKLGLLGLLTRARYASMLGNISTATLTGVSDVSNAVYASIVNLFSGKWKGVQNTVSSTVHSQIMERARDTFLQTMSANQFAFETEDAYNNRVSTARATTGNKVLDKVANILSWGSVAPTGGIDFLIKTPWGIRQGEMLASKIAKSSSMTADEIMLDAQNFSPLTQEGRAVREEVQNAMKDIEFMSEGGDGTLGSIATSVFTNMLDKGLETAIPNNKDLRGFIRSAILPFNTIATGQAARVINALVALPTGFWTGVQALYNAKRNGDGEAFVKYAQGMKPYIRDGISTAILAAILSALLDDEDIMPSWANATPEQKKLSKSLHIPFNSIRVGNTWVSIEYAGVLKSAFYMIPSIKSLADGEVRQAYKAYAKSVWDALADSPAYELVTSGFRDMMDADPKKAVENYGKSFIPRMYTSIQQLNGETNYYSPLTGDNKLTPQNNAYRFIFGSRVREGTIEQTNALIAARRGVNLAQTIKNTAKYREMTPTQKKEAEKIFASTYHQLIENYISKGLPTGDDVDTIKKIVRKLASKAREETFRRMGVK